MQKLRGFIVDKSRVLGEITGEPWKTILTSRQRLMVMLRWCVLILVLSLPVVSIREMFTSLSPVNFYQRDLIQEYLLAKALLAGEDLYLPLVELAARLLPDLPVIVFSHPTPHPPPVALISLPLALFTYEQAVVIWFIFETICVFLISYLLVDWWNAKRDWKHVLGLAFLMLGSAPFVIDIGFGQLSILLLLFLMFSWQYLRRGNEIVGGIFLGLVMALKLMAWPIVLYLLIKRRWRAVFSSGMVVLLSNGFMALLMGLEQFISYYIDVGPTVSAMYQGDVWNISVWGWGWTLFAGFDSSIAPFVEVSPLFESLTYLAPYAAIVCLLTVVSVGLYHALRLKEFDTAFGILVCISILANPTAWSHYFTWTVIPLAVLWRRLQKFEYPRVEFRLALMVTLLLAYFWRVLGWLVYVLAYMPFADTIAAMIGLATYLPTYVIFVLMSLVSKMGRVQSSHADRTSMGDLDV